MRRKTEIKWWHVVLAIAIILFMGNRYGLFTFGYTPSSASFVQYAGELHTQYASWWDDDRFNSDTTVEIGDYKFETIKYDQFLRGYCDSTDAPVQYCHVVNNGGTHLYTNGMQCDLLSNYTDEHGCEVKEYHCKYYSWSNNCARYGAGSHTTSCNCLGQVPNVHHMPTRDAESDYIKGGYTESNTDSGGHINYGCSYVIKVYKNNELIDTIGHATGNAANMTGSSQRDYDYIHAEFGEQKWYNYHECNSILNRFTVKVPNDAFNISISTPEEYYIQGDDAVSTIKIINNWKPVTSRVAIKVCQPTFGSKHCEIYSQKKELVLGENNINYSVPTRHTAEKLEITPTVEVYLNLNTFNLNGLNVEACKVKNDNLNAYCDKSNIGSGLIKVDKAKAEGYILYNIGSVTTNTTIVKVYPKEYEELLEANQTILTLNQSLEEQVAIIKQLNASIQYKAEIIQNLTDNLAVQAEYIQELTNRADEQAQYIEQLTDNINEQKVLIEQLTQERDQQQAIIDQLNLNINEKVELIRSLNATIEEQDEMIAHLSTTLQEKIELINQLTATNEEQARLIRLMNLSFANESYIIDQLNNKIEDDAAVIGNLTDSLSHQAEIIKNMNRTLQEDAILIQQLTDSNARQAEIIKKLNLTVAEQAEIINNMNLNLEEQAQIIKDLRLKVDEEQELVNNLNLTVQQQQQLIELLKNTEPDPIPQEDNGFKIPKDIGGIPTWVIIIGGVIFLLIIRRL